MAQPKTLLLLSWATFVSLVSLAAAQSGQQTSTTSSAPANVDSTYYENQAAPAPGSCPSGDSTATLTEELTEGPYYVDEELIRSNVTEGQTGVPLQVRITVLDNDCNPVESAFVDIWHCNATGYYSGYLAADQSGGGMSGRKLLKTGTDPSTTFLRGTVLTDSNGVAAFDTIFPGWYTGRTVHIHTRVHMADDMEVWQEESELEVYTNSSYISHTGQYFFEDGLMDEVFKLAPYSQHTGDVMTLEEDGVYPQDEKTIFTVTKNDASNLQAGLIASVTSIINRNATYEEEEDTTSSGGMKGMGSAPPMSSMGGMGGISLPPGFPTGISTSASSALPTLPQTSGRKLKSLRSW